MKLMYRGVGSTRLGVGNAWSVLRSVFRMVVRSATSLLNTVIEVAPLALAILEGITPPKSLIQG